MHTHTKSQIIKIHLRSYILGVLKRVPVGEGVGMGIGHGGGERVKP